MLPTYTGIFVFRTFSVTRVAIIFLTTLVGPRFCFLLTCSRAMSRRARKPAVGMIIQHYTVSLFLNNTRVFGRISLCKQNSKDALRHRRSSAVGAAQAADWIRGETVRKEEEKSF